MGASSEAPVRLDTAVTIPGSAGSAGTASAGMTAMACVSCSSNLDGRANEFRTENDRASLRATATSSPRAVRPFHRKGRPEGRLLLDRADQRGFGWERSNGLNRSDPNAEAFGE